MNTEKSKDECSVASHCSSDVREHVLTNQREPTGKPVFSMRCHKMVSVDMESEDGRVHSVLQFQDATIVSHRILDKDELSSMGLVAIGRWAPVEEEDRYARCIAELASTDSVGRFLVQGSQGCA